MTYDPYVNHKPLYKIGDILQVWAGSTEKYMLIEDMDEYVYRFRELLTGHTGVDSIFYLDSNKHVSKVA